MSLGSPHRTTGEMITASIWNTDLVDKLNSLQVTTDGADWTGGLAAVASRTAAGGASLFGHTLSATLTTAGVGTHPGFGGLLVNPPTVVGVAPITAAATLIVNGAPGAAVLNYALQVVGSGASQFQGGVQFYTPVNTGILFDDSRVSGVIATTVRGYVGPGGAQLLVQSTTDVAVAIGVNSLDHLTVNSGVNAPTVVVETRATTQEAMTFRGTGAVAHGYTTDTNTATYGAVRPVSPTNGGLTLNGYTETAAALVLSGNFTTPDTTKSGSSGAPIILVGNWLDVPGATAAGMGLNQNIVVIRNFDQTRFIFDSDGDFFFHGASAAFDEWDDVALVRALDLTTASAGLIETQWDAYVRYNKTDLEQAGIISADGMVCLTQHSKLLNGAIWQLFLAHQDLTERVAQLEAA